MFLKTSSKSTDLYFLAKSLGFLEKNALHFICWWGKIESVVGKNGEKYHNLPIKWEISTISTELSTVWEERRNTRSGA